MKEGWLRNLFAKRAGEPYVCTGMLKATVNWIDTGRHDYISYSFLETRSGKRKIQAESSSRSLKAADHHAYHNYVLKWLNGLIDFDEIPGAEQNVNAPKAFGYSMIGTYQQPVKVKGDNEFATVEYYFYERADDRKRHVAVKMSTPLKYKDLSFWNFAERWQEHKLQNKDLQHLLRKPFTPTDPVKTKRTGKNPDTAKIIQVDFSQPKNL